MRKRFFYFLAGITLSLLSFVPQSLAITMQEINAAIKQIKAEGKDVPDKIIAYCNEIIAEYATEDKEMAAYASSSKARAYEMKNDFASSRASLQDAIELNPTDDTLYYLFAYTYRGEGNMQQCYDVCTEHVPMAKDPDYYSYNGCKKRCTILANALWREYDGNSIQAEEKYAQKMILVRGEVQSVSRDISTKYPVVEFDLYTYYKILGSVECTMAVDKDNNAVTPVNNLKKGQDIILKGMVTEFRLNRRLLLNECTLLPE
jgi:tetratricopeptide (TPR) repeat protein